MGWNTALDGSGVTYYWNEAGQSQYERPADFDASTAQEMCFELSGDRWFAQPDKLGDLVNFLQPGTSQPAPNFSDAPPPRRS